MSAYLFNENHPSPTFSIEIEFFMVFERGAYDHLYKPPPDNTKEDALFSIPSTEILAATPVDFARFAIEQQFQRVRVPFENAAEAALDDAPDRIYDTWYVAKDGHSLKEDETETLIHLARDTGKTYDVTSCELISRKFDYHYDDWRGEIASALASIKSLENRDCCVLTNKETGFHVHIGLGDKIYKLSGVRNLLILMAAFERCFDYLHPVSRIEHSQNNPCRPLSWICHSHLEYDSLCTLDHWLQYLSTANVTDLEQFFQIPFQVAPGIIHYISSYHQFSVDISRGSLNDGFDRVCGTDLNMQTIEFRQHTSTLDYNTMVSWIEVCARLVSISSWGGADQFVRQLIETNSMNPDLKVTDLLASFDIPENVLLFYHKKLNVTDYNVVEDERCALGYWQIINSPLTPLITRVAVNRLNDSMPSAVRAFGVQYKLSLGQYGSLFGGMQALDESKMLRESVKDLLAEVAEDTDSSYYSVESADARDPWIPSPNFHSLQDSLLNHEFTPLEGY